MVLLNCNMSQLQFLLHLFLNCIFFVTVFFFYMSVQIHSFMFSFFYFLFGTSAHTVYRLKYTPEVSSGGHGGEWHYSGSAVRKHKPSRNKVICLDLKKASKTSFKCPYWSKYIQLIRSNTCLRNHVQKDLQNSCRSCLTSVTCYPSTL